jgi:peptidoglycan hydrolase-like protein with peptidoglycan-binding domain
MSYYRFGDKGDVVSRIQIALDIEPVDGIFGRITEAAIKNYQSKKGMFPDGVVTPELLYIILDMEYSTDLQESKESELEYTKYWLPKGEYSKNKTPKEYLFLHHTAGNHNPYQTIDIWAKDNRGAIATEFVIGGTALNGNDEFDGEILQAFPEGHWAYHLGGVNRHMHYHSVGIELCNFGQLIEKKDIFYTIYGQRVPEEYVCDLGYKFRGHRYYHNYTDKQLESTEKLIKFLQKRDKFDVNKGLKEYLNRFDVDLAFDYQTEAVEGKVRGILSHTNVNKKDKCDVYPHPKLVEMINNLK